MKANNEKLMSAYELAKHYGVSHTIIYRKIAAGEIEVVRIGKTNYIDFNKYSNLTFNENKIGERV